jgi:pimeloyl-ACP methyl ester carboxylesterase
MKLGNQNLFLLFILFSIPGCGNKKDTYPVLPSDAGTNSFILKSGSFKIGSEKFEADFGTIAVQENRSNIASRLIHIPFIQIHTPSKNPAEPIFGFAGGPGASNMTWDWSKALTFLSKHDFVLVGYRGVDGSIKLDCPEVTKAFRESSDLFSDKSMNMIGHAWSVSAERLKAKGIDLNGYSMLQCIEDNELVRQALGYKRIDLLSESYGTRLAYLYALAHPENIFRSVMISVNPPGHFVWEAQVIDSQLKYYADLWLKDPGISLKNPDLYSTMEAVLNAMPHKWLCFKIDPGKVRVVTFALLFHRKTSAMVFNAYVAAKRGDPSGLALMSLAYDHVVPSMNTWGDLASKAVSADFDPEGYYCNDREILGMPLGSPMTKLLWCPLIYFNWPVERIPEEFRRLRYSDVETLLMSGSLDFSTPAEFAANELMPFLKNGKQVILSECGHVNDMWYANNENTRLILTSFYDTGIPNTSRNSYLPMDFSVSWGFPAIVKIALGFIIITGIVLVFIMIWIVRTIPAYVKNLITRAKKKSHFKTCD